MTPLSHNMPCIIWSLLSVVCKCGLQCSRGWEVLWEAHHLWAQVTERGSVLFGLPCLSAPTAHIPVLPVLLRAEGCKRLNPESRLGWPIGGTRTETGRRKRDGKAEERPAGGRETGRRKRDQKAEERPAGGREAGASSLARLPCPLWFWQQWHGCCGWSSCQTPLFHASGSSSTASPLPALSC